MQSQGSDLTVTAEVWWDGLCDWDVGVKGCTVWERQTRKAAWFWWQHLECIKACLGWMMSESRAYGLCS